MNSTATLMKRYAIPVSIPCNIEIKKEVGKQPFVRNMSVKRHVCKS